MEMSEKLPDQNETPETIFVLGAGASLPAGVPLQAELYKEIYKASKRSQNEKIKNLSKFIDEVFSAESNNRSIEELTSIIDYFAYNEYDLRGVLSYQDIAQLRDVLSLLIHSIVAKAMTPFSEYAKHFWRFVRNNKLSIGLINLNYDTVFEEAFDCIYPEYLIDYCVDFSNYYETRDNPFNWWVDPKKPVPEGWNSNRVKIIKPHGSINWKYCRNCTSVNLTPWQSGLDFHTGLFVNDFGIEAGSCPVCGSSVHTLLQQPTHSKNFKNYVFTSLHRHCVVLCSGAKHIVFIGYSFPEADVHMRGMLKRSFSRSIKITVINPSGEETVRPRYQGLTDHLTHIKMGVEEFFEEENLHKTLIAP